VLSTTGHTLFQGVGNMVDTSLLAQNSYLIHIFDNDGTAVVKPFVK